jgi:hypothetical protein
MVDRFTQRQPAVVNRLTGHIEAGNTRTRAIAAAHQWIAAVLVEDDPSTERAYALADNRAHDLGFDDDALLAQALLQVNDADDIDLLLATGYDQQDLDSLVADVLRDTQPAVSATLDPTAFSAAEHLHPEPNATWTGDAYQPTVTQLPPNPRQPQPGRDPDPDPQVTVSIAVPRSLRHPLTRRLEDLMNETGQVTMGAALARHFELDPED